MEARQRRQSRDESAFHGLVEVSRKIHARDSLQRHWRAAQKCHINFPLLALGADPSPRLFVCSFFPPSQLCFVCL